MGRRTSSHPWPATSFPGWLRAARERAGMTLRQLATASGLDGSTIHRYETGRIVPPLPAALLLARLLKADIADVELLDSPDSVITSKGPPCAKSS